MNPRDTESGSSKRAGSREALLRSAQRLFIEKGYECVSTRELAEDANVNLGAIQYHFGSKAGLFVATVQSMMQGSACVRGRMTLDGPVESDRDAARALCEFVIIFLDYLLRPRGPQVCKLMFREIFSETIQDKEMFEALVSSVVNEFSRPTVEMLEATMGRISPEMSPEQLRMSAHSLAGQCSFYVTHRPFLERLDGDDFEQTEVLTRIARHICTFSLRGLGKDDKFVAAALKAGFARAEEILKQEKV